MPISAYQIDRLGNAIILSLIGLLTLGDEDSLVDVWQAAREERAELYEVVDSDAIFFVLARVRSALLR